MRKGGSYRIEKKGQEPKRTAWTKPAGEGAKGPEPAPAPTGSAGPPAEPAGPAPGGPSPAEAASTFRSGSAAAAEDGSTRAGGPATRKKA